MQNKLPAKTAILVVFIFSLVLEYLPISSSWQDVKVKKKTGRMQQHSFKKLNVGRCSLFIFCGINSLHVLAPNNIPTCQNLPDDEGKQTYGRHCA